jgi:elongation factor G
VFSEPYAFVSVANVPNEKIGDVCGDLNRRRCALDGIEQGAGGAAIRAEGPLAELIGYASALRALTDGHASCELVFTQYKPTVQTDPEAPSTV